MTFKLLIQLDNQRKYQFHVFFSAVLPVSTHCSWHVNVTQVTHTSKSFGRNRRSLRINEKNWPGARVGTGRVWLSPSRRSVSRRTWSLGNQFQSQASTCSVCYRVAKLSKNSTRHSEMQKRYQFQKIGFHKTHFEQKKFYLLTKS